MAALKTFAQVDEHGTIANLVIVDEADAAHGPAFLTDICRLDGEWIDVTDDSRVQIGFQYQESVGSFLPPQPFQSWVVDEQNLSWVAPVPIPGSPGEWSWDEATLSWVSPEPSA